MSLPWLPYKDGFLTFPEGDNRRTRYAPIAPEHHPSQRWRWVVAHETARIRGAEEDKQSATDAAEAAWQMLARAEWEDQMVRLIYRAQAGKVGPPGFNIATTSREDLLWIMEHIEKRPLSPGLTA